MARGVNTVGRLLDTGPCHQDSLCMGLSLVQFDCYQPPFMVVNVGVTLTTGVHSAYLLTTAACTDSNSKQAGGQRRKVVFKNT